MLPVEIVPVDGSTLVLRARGSELLILPHHIGHLKGCKTPKEFTGYFLSNALLNRPARKLFEAWLRKDKTLWQRIYRTIHDNMEVSAEEDKPAKLVKEEKPVAAKAPSKKPAPDVKEQTMEEAPAKASKEKAAPTKKKVAAKKEADEPKKEPAKKKVAAIKKDSSSTTKKAAKKKAASPAKKKASTKKATKSVTKSAPTKKKSTKKKKG